MEGNAMDTKYQRLAEWTSARGIYLRGTSSGDGEVLRILSAEDLKTLFAADFMLSTVEVLIVVGSRSLTGSLSIRTNRLLKRNCSPCTSYSGRCRNPARLAAEGMASWCKP